MVTFIYITTLVIISSAYSVENDGGNQSTSRILSISLTYGLSIAVLVYCSGHISGGHINPAVTWMLLFIGDYTPLRTLCYNLVQFSGALIGALLAWATTSGLSDPMNDPPANLGVNTKNPYMFQFGAFLCEMMGTALLCFSVYMTAVRGKGPSDGSPNLAPLVIGFTVFLAHIALIPLSGSCINPARYFGPAIVTYAITGDEWPEYAWIYWIGPLCGALLIAAIHFFMDHFLVDDEDPFEEFRDLRSGALNYMNLLLRPSKAAEVFKRRSTNVQM